MFRTLRYETSVYRHIVNQALAIVRSTVNCVKDFVFMFCSVPLLWTKIFLALQTLICYLVFFADKKGKFIAIKNRSVIKKIHYIFCLVLFFYRGLFNWFSYLFFFYNGFAGFFGAVMRALVASGFSLLLLFRLDTVVLMRGFERFDYGKWAAL